MISAIAHHYLAVNRLYAGLSERGMADTVPATQVALETDFAKALAEPLEAYYNAPFNRGYGSVPTKSQAATRCRNSGKNWWVQESVCGGNNFLSPRMAVPQ
jgi:hypothetical protein